MKTATTIAFLAAMLAPAAVLAQGATAVPLDKATVSKEVAQRTLMKNQISATVARQIVDACVDFARNQAGGPGTYAIFVLAPNGDIVDAHVMDGVLPPSKPLVSARYSEPSPPCQSYDGRKMACSYWPCFAPDADSPAGGVRTESTLWMTPFVAFMSA
jgi:hypothetical protein